VSLDQVIGSPSRALALHSAHSGTLHFLPVLGSKGKIPVEQIQELILRYGREQEPEEAVEVEA
jgi:hypothetical protein